MKHHLLKIIQAKDSKITELENEVDTLQNFRIENEILTQKMAKMTNQMEDLKQEICKAYLHLILNLHQFLI